MITELSQGDLSNVLGLTTRQIRNLEEQGMPHRADGRRKFYPVPGAVLWYIERQRQEAAGAAESTDYELARAKREMARARLAEMEVAEREKRLLPTDVVDEVYGGAMDTLRAGIRNMPGRWGAQVVGLKSPRQGEAALKRVAAELLESFTGPTADAIEFDDGSKLPEDFPGLAPLAAAGIETMSDLLGVDDLRAVPGIGPATERKIQEALREVRAVG